MSIISGMITRIGMAIGVKEDRLDEYRAVHADDHPGVRDLLAKAHMRNFSPTAAEKSVWKAMPTSADRVSTTSVWASGVRSRFVRR